MSSAEAVRFDIERNDIVGRYAVASCDLEPGDEILSEIPFAYGPKTDSPPVCLGCYATIDCAESCSICGWPVCSASCESAPAHRDAECRAFASAKVKFFPVKNTYAPCLQYECITPLRVLLATERDAETWNEEIKCMQSHTVERRTKEIWNFNTINVVNYLRGPCGLQRFTPDLIHEICGILDVNTFEAPTMSGNTIRCLYPKASIFSHNCVTNIAHSIFSDGYGPNDDHRIVIRSATCLEKGSELFARYAYSTLPTMVRREFLKESKYFECRCERCSDPTELGTHMSTLKCNKCDNGHVLSTSPLDQESDWKCTHCSNTLPASATRKIFRTVQDQIEQVDAMEPSAAAVDAMENLYKKYTSILHPRNAYLTSLRISLAQMYGRVEGYTFDVMPGTLYERKVELCHQILKNIDVIEPGFSRLRGRTMYELYAPVVLLSKNLYKSGDIAKNELRERIQYAIDLLEESSKILLLEPATSNEGRLGRFAKQAFHQLSENINEIVENA